MPLIIIVVHFHALNCLSLHLVALVVAWLCELKPVFVRLNGRGEHAVSDELLIHHLGCDIITGVPFLVILGPLAAQAPPREAGILLGSQQIRIPTLKLPTTQMVQRCALVGEDERVGGISVATGAVEGSFGMWAWRFGILIGSQQICV